MTIALIRWIFFLFLFHFASSFNVMISLSDVNVINVDRSQTKIGIGKIAEWEGERERGRARQKAKARVNRMKCLNDWWRHFLALIKAIKKNNNIIFICTATRESVHARLRIIWICLLASKRKSKNGIITRPRSSTTCLSLWNGKHRNNLYDILCRVVGRMCTCDVRLLMNDGSSSSRRTTTTIHRVIHSKSVHRCTHSIYWMASQCGRLFSFFFSFLSFLCWVFPIAWGREDWGVHENTIWFINSRSVCKYSE